MWLSFVKQLDFCIPKTNVDTQKINSNKLEISGMIIAFLLMDDKDGKSYFFKKTFVLADISIYIAFKIFLLTLSNVRINFNN